MLNKTLSAVFCLTLILGAGSHLFASPILLPGGSLTVSSLTGAGVSFTYTGTLTQNDTLALTQTGDPCLQSPPSYCTNGAGVVTVAGSSPVGAATTFSGTFGGTTATWDFGSLLLEISGAGTVQIFPADAANGLGSSTPPLSLTLPSTSLSSLGFSAFSQVNPTITFVLADNLYTDNSGQFTLTQAPATQTPEPATAGLVGILICALGWFRRRL
jgi:hypothetical protein